MSIGGGIFLMAVGAILVWAVNVETSWVNLDMIGYILLAAGAVVFIIGIAMLVRRRTSVSTTSRNVGPGGEEVTRNESSTPEV